MSQDFVLLVDLETKEGAETELWMQEAIDSLGQHPGLNDGLAPFEEDGGQWAPCFVLTKNPDEGYTAGMYTDDQLEDGTYVESHCLVLHMQYQDVLGTNVDPRTLKISDREPRPPEKMLDEETLTRALEATRPAFVRRFGLSAVSPKIAAEMWWIAIHEDRDLDHESENRGYMVAPMWKKFPDAGWNDVREWSFQFGWKCYPPCSGTH